MDNNMRIIVSAVALTAGLSGLLAYQYANSSLTISTPSITTVYNTNTTNNVAKPTAPNYTAQYNQPLAEKYPTKMTGRPITITAVGDVMIGSSFPNEGYLPDDDAKYSFREVQPYLKGDIIFGNLEGSLLDEGDSAKCPPASTSCYAFRMPTRYGAVIKNAGFNLMSVANNHIGDFGDAGRQSTLQTLSQLGIQHAGLTQKPTAIFEKNGVRYGFAAFAPNMGTVSINDLDNAANIVRSLKQQTDIVIVSFHGGAEGATHTHVPHTNELFLGENRGDVYKFAHTMIDAGADILIGQGPHVTRAVEVYKNKFIAYSLGNFNTYGAFNLKGVNGFAPLLNVKLKSNGDFESADVTSIKQTKEQRLQLDPSNQAFNALRDLTQEDFPNNGLVFQNNRITLR